MNRNVIKDLKKFDIFSDFSTEELFKIKPFVYWRTYKKGQLLFIENDPRERIYFLLNGYVKLIRVNKFGELNFMDYIKSYSMFPYGGLLVDKKYHFSAEAVTDIELFYLPTSIFEEKLRNNKNQLIKIVNNLSAILEIKENRVQKITTPGAQQRVILTINYLMSDLGEHQGADIIINCPITTTEISQLAGTSRETVSQVFKQLKKDHVITIDHKKIVIHRPEYLGQSSV